MRYLVLPAYPYPNSPIGVALTVLSVSVAVVAFYVFFLEPIGDKKPANWNGHKPTLFLAYFGLAGIFLSAVSFLVIPSITH